MLIHHYLIDCPWPVYSGGDIRNAAIASALKRLPDVSYRCFGLTPANSPVSTACNYQQIRGFSNTNPWRRFKQSCPTELDFPVQAIDHVKEHLQGLRVGLAVFEGVAWGPVIHASRRLLSNVVLDMHNIESDLWSQQLRQSSLRRQLKCRLLRPGAVQATRQLDTQLSQLADQTWVCSESDRDHLERLGGRADRIIPNPIPDESALEVPIPVSRYADPTPIYVGHLGYFPNVDAVNILANEVTSEARRLGVQFQPVVAGRSPLKQIRRLSRLDRIKLLANPNAMLPTLADHGYTVVPLRRGSGTRIKILEAFAAGVVVIASNTAREGIDVVNGEHFFESDTPASMAETLIHLSRHPEQAAAVASNARAWVLKHHGQEALRQAVQTTLAPSRV